MRRAARAAALACLLATTGTPAAAAGEASTPPRDADFGVAARGAIGLERQVAMYQWTRDGNGYAKAWSGEVVDSSGFIDGHDNPPAMPLRARRWMPVTVSLDGHPVDPAAIRALAEWQPLRPDFSALPGNLSATFQPEGDGLGSAANPAHPEIGDLRITWRELRMPATYAGLALRNGRWELDRAALAARGPSRDQAAAPARARGSFAWIVLGALAAAVLAAAWMLRRRRRRG